jgi:hypothetical protein
MNVRIFGCRNCGAPLKIVESQFVAHCHYCKCQYYLKQNSPPAVVLKPLVNMGEAKRLILKALRHSSVAKKFLHNSYFEKALMYYIPFFEVRGIKAGWDSSLPTEKGKFRYQAFDYLEKANKLNELQIDFFDYSIVEDSILNSLQDDFNPVDMRKQGVIISPERMDDFKKEHNQHSYEVVEKHLRVIYFPVWEICYTYKGIIFKSYLSAIDGKVMKLHALKNHQTKLLMAIGGLFGLGALLTRSFKLAFVMSKTPMAGFSLTFLFLGFPLLLFLTAILFPYLWRLFAFREEVIIRGKLIESHPINYTENNLIRYSRIFGEKFTRMFAAKKED